MRHWIQKPFCMWSSNGVISTFLGIPHLVLNEKSLLKMYSWTFINFHDPLQLCRKTEKVSAWPAHKFSSIQDTPATHTKLYIIGLVMVLPDNRHSSLFIITENFSLCMQNLVIDSPLTIHTLLLLVSSR